jgi:hypothetical protein
MKQATLASIILIICGCNSYRESLDDVHIENVGSIYAVVFLDDQEPDEDRFQINPNDYPRFLDAFKGASIDAEPAKWQERAQISLQLKSGKSVFIGLYLTHQQAGAFRIGKTYYRGSTDENLHRMIMECRAHSHN